MTSRKEGGVGFKWSVLRNLGLKLRKEDFSEVTFSNHSNLVLQVDGMDSFFSAPAAESATPATPALQNSLVVGPVCRNSFKLLSCNAPRTINIVYTFYGRQSQQYCPE